MAATAFVHQPRPMILHYMILDGMILDRRSDDGAYQICHLACGQSSQRHEFSRCGQVCQCGVDAGFQLVGPVCADQHQCTRLGTMGQKAQQVNAGSVRPVQVVEDDHQRGAG